MADFEDLIDSFVDLLSGINLPEGDELMENVHNTLNSLINKISDAHIGLSDEQTTMIVEKFAEAFHLPEDTVSSNLDAIIHTNSESLADKVSDKVSEIPIAKENSGSAISFTGNCWDECIASVQDAGKRLTCGYHA